MKSMNRNEDLENEDTFLWRIQCWKAAMKLD